MNPYFDILTFLLPFKNLSPGLGPPIYDEEEEDEERCLWAQMMNHFNWLDGYRVPPSEYQWPSDAAFESGEERLRNWELEHNFL